jgi:hypothetical protein
MMSRSGNFTLVVENTGAGFFSNFNAVITLLDKGLDRKGLKAIEVDWRQHPGDTQFPYGRPEDGNLWLQYFEPLPFDAFPETRLRNRGSFDNRIGGSAAYAMYKLFPAWRSRYHAIYQRSIHILPRVTDRVAAIEARWGRERFRLGVHYRNPLHAEECPFPMPSPDTFVERARRLLPQGRPHVVFLATDIEPAIAAFRAAFGESLVVQPNVARADGSGDQIHHSNPSPSRDIGDQVLVDCLLLSRCDALLHVVSNIATAAGYINPNLTMVYSETRLEAALGYTWSLWKVFRAELSYRLAMRRFDRRIRAQRARLAGTGAAAR